MARSVFDIFLASTSADLTEHRRKVATMVARMRQTTIAMETFGAKPARPLATCRAEVARCDALIVLVGHRYGWVPAKKDGGDGRKSITWWEVQWALESNPPKPVYAFLVEPSAPWQGLREQDRLLTARTSAEVDDIARAVRGLQDFRDFLERETTRELFTSADDLGGKVATSLSDWLLTQAAAVARAAVPPGLAHPLPPGPPQMGSPSLSAAGVDFIRWQEQVHLLSARAVVGQEKRVKIALLAGTADTRHPSLSTSDIRQLDVRAEKSAAEPDDFTTTLASLMVGKDARTNASGVVPDAHLLVIQVLSRGSTTTTADLIAAIDAAIREGAQALCIPLGGTAFTAIEQEIYERAAELGVVCVCAAGNEASSEPIYPAAYPDCISVAAVDANDELASFSSFGEWVTAAAPGVDIPNTAGSDGYNVASGTSHACAIATGIVALMLSCEPSLTPTAIKEILRRTGGIVARGGTLRLVDAASALRAVRQAQRGSPEVPPAPAAAARLPEDAKGRPPTRGGGGLRRAKLYR